MSNYKVSIIMYHYVRSFAHSRYRNIKGIDIADFKNQIGYLIKNYNFITMEMLIDSIDNNSSLPEKSVLLTFDDGYKDHFEFVFPFLDKMKIQGSFFPSAKAITEHDVLDVNKIHFILASEDNKSRIISEIFNELKKYRKDYDLESDSYYYEKYAKSTRFDSAEVIFIKRILQVVLDEAIRKEITEKLFEKIVGVDAELFSRELYMDLDQIKCMHKNGMHIGSHGYDHYWLGLLTPDKQKYEIEKSLMFLDLIGIDLKQWTMCYPYGNYSDVTTELLNEYNCKLALTTEVNIADIHKFNKFTLPRLDTNDLPLLKTAATNEWYLKG